ncbi:RNA-binding domain-containing protein [Nocardioides marmoraquaticus]
MELEDLEGLIADLRAEGSDTAELEVKRARDGFPEIAETLSAFANTPGGGTLVFGLDEKSNFAAVGVYDAADCQAKLASKARQAVQPPVTIETRRVEFEGEQVVVAHVHEAPSSAKPCRVVASQKAYLRAYDGDYALSELEERAIANRSEPSYDRAPVAGTSINDLDTGLLRRYLESSRGTSSTLNRFEDAEVLFRTGVTHELDGSLTVAGLLALGVYPQQWFPNYVIQASVSASKADGGTTRALDIKRFDGPVPLMLDEALAWVRRNSRTRLRIGASGGLRDEPEFPAVAVRELLSNALIHRDLGPHALGEAITLNLSDSQLVLVNPGGLWGIAVDRLGKEGVTSARNGHLLRICQNVRTASGERVVEALATGIPNVLAALSAAGMVPPRFLDQSVRFTNLAPNHALLGREDLDWLSSLDTGNLTDRQRHVLVAMRHGQPWTNRSLREVYPMDSRDAHRELQGLVDSGFAEAVGERGGRTYQLAGDALRGSLMATDGRLVFPRDDDGLLRAEAEPGRATKHQQALLQALAEGPSTVNRVVEKTGLSRRQVTYALEVMRQTGLVVMHGKQGVRDTTYEIA